MKSFLNKLVNINVYPFSISIAHQKRLLDKFPEPIDLFDRSYYQYSVQFEVVPVYRKIFNNLVGLFALCFFMLRAILNRFGWNHQNQSYDSKTAVFPYKNYHYPNILPIEVRREFKVIDVNFMDRFHVGRKDLSFILRLFSRYPFQFYFLSKCISKILFFRYIIQEFRPQAIISCAEYSFSSSVATQYCRENDVEHINIMHGEKLFIIKDSFFAFDRFYVWDTFYIDLFRSLKASPNQFIVGTFPSLKMDLREQKSRFKYTYYLAAEQVAELKAIRSNLLQLASPNEICIRLHPRYSNIETIEEIFDGFSIEDPRLTSLKDSFIATDNVISLYSSCLTQAYFNNKSIIIDDLSHDPKKISELKQSGYIVMFKPHQLLSSIVKKQAFS